MVSRRKCSFYTKVTLATILQVYYSTNTEGQIKPCTNSIHEINQSECVHHLLHFKSGSYKPHVHTKKLNDESTTGLCMREKAYKGIISYFCNLKLIVDIVFMALVSLDRPGPSATVFPWLHWQKIFFQFHVLVSKTWKDYMAQKCWVSSRRHARCNVTHNMQVYWWNHSHADYRQKRPVSIVLCWGSHSHSAMVNKNLNNTCSK